MPAPGLMNEQRAAAQADTGKPSPDWWLYSACCDMVTQCIIERSPTETWLLTIWQGDFMTVSHESESRDAAVRLGSQIWTHLRERGWMEREDERPAE
jgi:hypothetical protein